MELKGLKALFLGDSITEGYGGSAPDKVWWRVLGERTGMETVGYGVGGTRIVRLHSEINEEDQDFIARAMRMDRQADIIGVFGGTNDYGHGLAGTPDDTEFFTFYGALDQLYTYLQTTYPDAFIFVMTPTHRTDESSIRGDGIREEPLTMQDYVNIVRAVAQRHSLPVLDLWAELGIDPKIPLLKERFMPDGLHPNDAGYARIARMVEHFLRTHYYG